MKPSYSITLKTSSETRKFSFSSFLDAQTKFNSLIESNKNILGTIIKMNIATKHFDDVDVVRSFIAIF